MASQPTGSLPDGARVLDGVLAVNQGFTQEKQAIDLSAMVYILDRLLGTFSSGCDEHLSVEPNALRFLLIGL